MSHPPLPNFHATHWCHRPPWQSDWHALDSQFGNGQAFLDTLQAWHADKQAPKRLYYSAFSETAPDHLAPQLKELCFGLLPGVHRISFENLQVHLNLCIGPLEANFKEIDITADSICIGSFVSCDARWIARLSKLETNICWSEQPTPEVIEQLKGSGYQLNERQSSAVFQPPWQIKTALRSSRATSASLQNKAIVIGAGLAGSAVAYSLAQRGWQVEVIDQHGGLGGGASALPAGIFATHVSRDNNVLSRITRDGVRAAIQRASSLLKRGHDWELSHLVEHQFSGKRALPTADLWKEAGLEWSAEAHADHKKLTGLYPETQALWHPMAGWVQTQALVKAQLQHKRIECRFGINIKHLIRQHSTWQLVDDANRWVAEADHVVVANAHACQNLLDNVQHVDGKVIHIRPLIPITPLRGQVTYGPMSLLNKVLKDKLPALPVNGHGSFMGNLPALQDKQAEPYWVIGSSFQRHDLDTQIRPEDQHSNLKQWAELMPAWHDEILENVDLVQAHGWAGIRASLPDRLPAVGALNHADFEGLQVCTGMGARGLSWSALCGELLAAQMNHEPLPMAASLAKLMAASRFG
jgi:tRNA 5-methylaminomethyl-2-thiouridine biosynthesis bifunctional protein